mgnify:CR=1 FL=1
MKPGGKSVSWSPILILKMKTFNITEGEQSRMNPIGYSRLLKLNKTKQPYKEDKGNTEDKKDKKDKKLKLLCGSSIKKKKKEYRKKFNTGGPAFHPSNKLMRMNAYTPPFK